MRHLYVTKAGYWYIALTIALGVVALATANNVLTLMECMLLGGMILSGVVSEKAISSIEVALEQRQAIAGIPVRDLLIVTNHSRLPFFCVELLEWQGGRFAPLAFLAKISAGERRYLPTARLFEQRGAHRWQGLGVATAAPFGFARKIRVATEGGSRIVWPEAAGKAERNNEAGLITGHHAGLAEASAEVRLFAPGDDARSILWTLSAKGTEPVVRKRHEEKPEVALRLDLEKPAGEEFERCIRRLAGAVYRAGRSREVGVRLRVSKREFKRTIVGRKAVLDYLAAVQPGATR